MNRFWEQLRRFWQSDLGLTLLLAILATLIFVAPAFELIGRRGRTLIDALFTALMVAGVGVVSSRRGARIGVIVLGVGALAVRWLVWLVPTDTMRIASSILSLAMLGVLAALTLTQVVRAGRVNLHRILGAVAVYLLLGLMWGEAYEAFAIARPDAFLPAGAADPQRWMYFSFVTLTTTGYGDITPVAPAARSLAVLEAITGQLFVAIMIARLVSLEVASRADR